MNRSKLRRRFEKVQSSEITVLFFELGMISKDFFNRKKQLENEDWFEIIDEVRRRGFSDDEIQQYLDNLHKFVLEGIRVCH